MRGIGLIPFIQFFLSPERMRIFLQRVLPLTESSLINSKKSITRKGYRIDGG